MTSPISLAHLLGAYRRISSRIYRILEDGYDFEVADRIIETLDLDALIIDAAFFVLIFGQLENRLNQLARQRAKDSKARTAAMRDAKFTKRLEVALPKAENKAIRREIEGWYTLRNDAAHGERLTYTFDVATVFDRAFELDSLVAAQLRRSGN